VGGTERNQTKTERDGSEEEKLSGAKSIHKKTHDRSQNTHFQTAEAGRKRDLGIAPAELLPDGLKERSETKEDDATDVQVDDETGGDDPPSVVEILKHHHFFYWISWFYATLLAPADLDMLFSIFQF